MRIPSGVIDQYINFVAVDATDFSTRETGLTGFTVYRSRDGGTPVAMTTPTIVELSAGNMPGVYALLCDEDMTIGAGNDSEEMVFNITVAGMAIVTRTIELYRSKITQGETLTVDTGVAEANVVQVSGDAVAADNLELQYDGTGLTGDTFPSTQAQVGNIATGTSALGANASGAVITAGTETGTFLNTQSDGPLHIISDAAGNTDFYYTVTLGGNAVLSSVLWTGYIQSNGDTTDIQFYDWTQALYVTERILNGANGTTQTEQSFAAVSAYTGTGANLGQVRFRFLSTTTTNIATNRLIFEFTNVNQSVGYDGARVWLDTNSSNTGTVPFVDGVADNPTNNLTAARTIADAVGLTKISATALSAYTINDDYSLFEISGVAHQMTASGAFNLPSRTEDCLVTGTSTGTTPVSFIRCQFVNFSYAGQIFIDQAALTGGITSAGDNPLGLRNVISTVGSYIDVTAGVNQTHYLDQIAGALEIRGLTAGDTIYICGGCEITLAASCTGGTVRFYGATSFTNNGSGMTFVEDSRINTDVFASKVLAESIEVDTGTDIPAQIAALNDFNPATDTVANVTLVDTTTTNTDMRGTDGALPAADVPVNFKDMSITASTGFVDITQAAADKVWSSTSRTLTDGIQKNQAFNDLEFLMVLTSDHVTPAPGLTVTGERSIDGGAFAAITGAIAEVSNGIYVVDLTAADTNGDTVTYRFSSATADDTFITITTS